MNIFRKSTRIGCFVKVCNLLLCIIPQGRFSLAARYHSNVAEVYENELQDYDKAISNYEQAADFHRGEDSVRYSPLPQGGHNQGSLSLCSWLLYSELQVPGQLNVGETPYQVYIISFWMT